MVVFGRVLICPPKQARALVQAENRLQDPNFRNAKILYQSRYLICGRLLTELRKDSLRWTVRWQSTVKRWIYLDLRFLHARQ
jgi:hypothetical protein